MITIRPTTDAAFLAELNKEAQEHHHNMYPEIFRPYVKEEIAKAIRKMLGGRDARAFVAYDGEEPVGYALIFISRFNENAFQVARSAMQVDQLAVLSAHRRKGVAKALLEHLEQIAREEKIPRLDLNHWAKNDLAKEFFGKQGFSYYNSRMYKDVQL
jgi:ribosomal protein S18 acetylase RimI-like enzyme